MALQEGTEGKLLIAIPDDAPRGGPNAAFAIL